MAKIKNIAEVSVYINGKEEAKRDLEDLKRRAGEINDEIDKLKKKKVSLAESIKTDPSKAAEYDETRKQLEKQVKEHKKLQKVIRETENFARDIEEDLQNMSGQSLARLKQLERSLTAIRQRLNPEEDKKGDFLSYLNGKLKELADTVKSKKGDIIEFKDVLDDLTNIDDTSLAKVEQRLKSLLASTDKDAVDRIKQLKEELAQVQSEKNRRVQAVAVDVQDQVQKGTYKGTIEETEKAIAVQREYQKTLDTADAKGLKKVEDTIAALQVKLAEAKREMLSYDEAVRQAGEVSEGVWKGTMADLEKLKKSLEYHKKNTLKIGVDDKKIEELEKNISSVDKAIKGTAVSASDLDKIMSDLDNASVEDLEKAAKQLQEELAGATRNVKEYNDKAADLRKINLELKKAKKEWEGQENVIARTAKRLMAYVAVYGGFNFIKGKVMEATRANLQLSDSFADIQKTTGLAVEAVKNLSRDIDSIDTRTSQQQLHELAATAGQIGLKSKEDVLGFVKASNMITVSLNELGSEGTASLMKLAQLTGDVKKLGVEKSLLAIGSAINELSANSAATAGPIVELMNRMGGIAAQSKISTAEMAAIGATADAIGQSMEITGTSMNKFIATLMSNSDQIAYALNMDAKALNELLEGGETMEAMLMVFERMASVGGLSKLAPIMGDLGSEGARMTQMLSAMASNVGMLREQVELSREAFADAISIENEYNIKNENAIALLERMGNTLKEMWVNSAFVKTLTWVLKHMNEFVKCLAEGDVYARILKTAMIALSTAIALATMHLDKFVKALFSAKTYTELFAGAWGKLGKALKANWISMAVSALAALAYYLYETFTHVTNLERATHEYNAELDRESNIMKNLFGGAMKDVSTKKERSKLISEINKRYKDYLGFMLKESDSISKIAAAQDLVNAKMRESMALRMSNKQREILDEEYGQEMAESRKEMNQAFLRWNLEGREKEAMAAVRRITISNIDKDAKEIQDLIVEEFKTLFGSSNAVSSEVFNFIKLQKRYYAEFNQINEEAAADLAAAQADVVTATSKAAEEMYNQMQDSIKDAARRKDIFGVIPDDMYKSIIEQGEEYLAFVEENMKDLTEEEAKVVNQNVIAINRKLNEIRKEAPYIDAWGKEANLKGWKETLDNLGTASIDSLVSTYKELRDAPKLISDVIKYNRMFGTSFTSLSEVMEDSKNKAEQIKNQLASMGRTTTGDFLWKSGGGGAKKPKDEFEAAIASLEAYYNDRETIVRKNALLEETTQEELDKRLQSLEQEHLSARIELRKHMLSKDNEFLTTFSHVAESEYMQGIDYEKLQTQLAKLGKAMAQGLEKNLTEDMVTLQKIAWAYQEEISKILVENDPIKKVAMEYQKSFEKIDMFWAADEQRTKDAANAKMATMLEFSTKRLELSDKEMRTELEKSKEFGGVVKTMTAEEYQAFLILLEQYAEAATNAKRQATQRAIKSLEFSFENSEMGKAVVSQLQNIEEMEKQIGDLSSSGLTREASVLSKQKEIAEQRIALELTKWNAMIKAEENGMNRQEVLQELMLQRDKATYQARLEIMKLIMGMDANMFSESGNRIGQMQGWGAISEIDATERQRTLINAELQLQQWRIDEMIRMEEEGQNRMDVINNLKQVKQDALMNSERKLTELTMQEYQQRAQIANEWGSAIGTGLGEMIAGTEDAGKALVKNLATMAVQAIGQMAQMYVAKQLLMSQQNMSEAASAMTTATTAAAEATAVGAAKTAEATAIAMATPDSVLTGGATGAAKAAVISGLIAAAVAASIAIINSLFPGAGSKATASNRKLSTGMLTYADGNYPVLGNDGKVYDAKYEGAGMKTGVYGGGAHFGIFSEKQPEMIVDGKTTQKIILNYPYIYDAITTIAKNGRLKNAMPTFAAGDYPAGMKQLSKAVAVDGGASSNEDMIQMRAALEQNTAAFTQLSKLLQGGITAHLDGLETHRQQKKNERFLKRRGID